MSDGQVKKCSAMLYFLECPALFGNRTSKNLGVLVCRTSEHFKKFLPLIYIFKIINLSDQVAAGVVDCNL